LVSDSCCSFHYWCFLLAAVANLCVSCHSGVSFCLLTRWIIRLRLEVALSSIYLGFLLSEFVFSVWAVLQFSNNDRF
jgi:hypothetical protein